MMKYQMRILYVDILRFITSVNIRTGEYEGNRYVVKKMDLKNFIIYAEDLYHDNHREIAHCTSIYRDNLIEVIQEYAKTKGHTLAPINLKRLR